MKLPLATSSDHKSFKQPNFVTIDSIPELLNGKSRNGALRKKNTVRVPGAKRTRRAIRFHPVDEEAFSSSDEEPFLDDPPRRSRSLRTDSSATLTNSRSEPDWKALPAMSKGDFDVLEPPRPRGADIPEYSDCEEDITTAVRDRDAPRWTPAFIRRHSARSIAGAGGGAGTPPPRAVGENSLPQPAAAAPATRAALPVASVPATPSLIRAVERIAAAQETVYRAQTQTPPSAGPATSGLPVSTSPQHTNPAWNSFWSEVKAKASS